MRALNSVLPTAPSEWQLEILYKSVRHIYFRLYPGEKKVRITAPGKIPRSDLDAAIQAKTPWLLKKIASLAPISKDDEGVCHYRGRSYPLVFQEADAPPGVWLDPDKEIRVRTRPGACSEKKAHVLSQWLRQCLKQEIRVLLDKWEPVLGVRAMEFGVKKMKTRWGSCNTRAARIWINLALIRHSPELLEYVLVHELVHLLEPSHNTRFYHFMDRFLPGWKADKARLDRYSPVN